MAVTCALSAPAPPLCAADLRITWPAANRRSPPWVCIFPNHQPTTQMTTEFVLCLLAVAAFVATLTVLHFRHVFTVQEGFAGLLYQNGRLREILAAGRHVRFGRNFRLATADTRKTLLQVHGQEVLTSDNVAVKLSVVLTTQVVDVAKSVQAVDNHVAHAYSAAQSAVRTVVAGLTMDALLTQRVALATQLHAVLVPLAEAVGVCVHTADVRDVMLPGELRKAFSETLKARQEGLATLERARSESAALRNLANVASLLENHPALGTLRFLQTLETSGGNRTLVMNDLAALFPTFASRTAKSTAPNPEA